MTLQAKDLAEYMSELSEQAYFAGWMKGLEYALWEAVLRGTLKYGHLQITRQHTAKLAELSKRCGGWIIWDEEEEESFVPIERWHEIYAAERNQF